MSKSLKLIIESMLFSSEKPLTVNDIRSCLPDVETSEIKSAIEILKYEIEALERSFELKEIAKGFQLRSRTEYGAYILRMFQKSPNRLSRAAMETLSIIAYKQPILRTEIERLRGVDVGGILRTLLEKGLIRIMGRKDLPGKPLIYGTTKLFLETFDLKDISSLPKLKEIKKFGTEEYEPTPAVQEGDGIVLSGENSEELTTSVSEDKPKEISSDQNTQDHTVPDDEEVSDKDLNKETTQDETRIKEDDPTTVQEEDGKQELSKETDQPETKSGGEPADGTIKPAPED
ncbi:SMC-Scp complex subunit ScpB [Thermodesulfobacteriota bacterium]